MSATDERGPIFAEVPSGLVIMHWFLDKTLAREWVGCGGDADYILSWDPESQTGSHVDLIAHVDHDATWFWLLSVGTQLDGGPTTYDLLFVMSDLDGERLCEWRNKPSTDQPWHYEGLVWFAGLIEEYERPHEATVTPVHLKGGPWAGQTIEVERVVGPVLAVGDPIGNHYWLDTKSDPPTYVWDGAAVES